jgi:phosphate transport system permease protein
LIETQRTLSARQTRRHIVDRFMTAVLTLSALFAAGLLVLILGYVIFRGYSALNLAFFTQPPLPVGEVGGGIAPAIIGTLTMLSIAALLGVPIGLATAIYLSEYGRGRLASMIRFVIDLLAGLPSIVVGVFVWALVVRNVIGNFSGFAGAVALAIIIIPITTRTAEEIIRLVPDSLREASTALGTRRWRTILSIVLPTARAGLVTGTVLALARAGGETAPLLLTALGNQFFNFDLRQPMAALPIQIYNYAVSPYDDWHTKAWGGAFVLIMVIAIFSLLTRLFASRSMRR